MTLKTQHPFNSYKAYKVFHKKEGRWYVQLKHLYVSLLRTTMSYARYLMSVKLGRLLDKKLEQVDHIDGNKLNDNINNLQLLSQLDNTLKSKKDKTIVNCVCDYCGSKFTRAKNLAHHTRKNVKCFCKKACLYNYLKIPVAKRSIAEHS